MNADRAKNAGEIYILMSAIMIDFRYMSFKIMNIDKLVLND